MGQVYRAKDTELDREVAIKVLLEAVARDPERIARFEREAKLLASLSHQNIATLHGIEEHDGQRFLVMELAEGETLAERLKKGARGAGRGLVPRACHRADDPGSGCGVAGAWGVGRGIAVRLEDRLAAAH